MTPKKQSTEPTPEQRARTKRLRRLMAVNEMKAEEVAEILGVKTRTIYVYRCMTSGTYISENDLQLLELKVAAMKAEAEAAEAAE